MQNWKYDDSLTMFLVGIWLMLQCYHVINREEEKIHIFCVTAKLIVIMGVLLMHPVPFFALFLFFAFYPKYETRDRKYGTLCLQMLLTIGASLFCGMYGPERELLSSVWFVVFLVVLFGMADFGIQNILLKNQQLYRQMENTALNELKVKNLNREISRRSQVAERNARLEEREHITRNIHNVVGHTITSALVSLQAYEVLKEADPERADSKLAAASGRMHLALEEIRRVVRVLDAETEEMEMKDFCSLLATEADKFSLDTEIQIIHNFEENRDKNIHIEKRTCEFLHSVLTECLNNGIRHGGASRFLVYLVVDGAHIQLVVSDNGKGFAGLTETEKKTRLENGYGLRKMKDYVQNHAGSFKIEEENGLRVQVELPLVTKAVERGE